MKFQITAAVASSVSSVFAFATLLVAFPLLDGVVLIGGEGVAVANGELRPKNSINSGLESDINK